ncbi:hypothetical protein Tco_0017676 [Tanacetum coccineum]
MNQEAIQQAAHEEAWVPKADKVKISTTNMRIDPTMTQKEETYQVVLNIIKNTAFYKAFLGSADVPEIYMQQFWFIVTKIKNTNFYEFKLENKKCLVDVEMFRQALDICPRFLGKEFIIPPFEEKLLTFLIRLGYASATNATSNDRLRQSRVAIIWGMFHKKYVDFVELVWEDLSYKIDNRCNVDYAIKQSETYKAFINYSIGLIPPKKTRGKGSQGKKSNVTPKPVSVEVSNESDLDPVTRRTSSKRISKKKVSISADDNIIPELDVDLELGNSMSLTKAVEEDAARQVHATHKWIVTKSDPEASGDLYDPLDYTSSVSKKISPDSSQNLKGIQTLTAEEQLIANTMQTLKANKESSRSQAHARGSSEGTGTKLGVPDESTVILTTSHEGIGTKPGVPDEVKDFSEAKADVTLDWGSEEESEYSKEENIDEEIDWVYSDEEEEKKDDDDDDKSIDIEKTDDEGENDDEFVQGDEYVQDNVDEEMKNAEVAKIGKGDEEIPDTAKADAEKSEEVKDDIKKDELPLSSSSLSVSSGFSNQFLNLSSDKSTVGNLKDSADAEINSFLDPSVISPIPEIPTKTPAITLRPPPPVTTIISVIQQQSTPIPTPPITIIAPVVTTIPDPLPTIIQRVFVLKKDVQELKEIDHTTTHLASLRSEIPSTQVDYKDVIEVSVHANVINEVKNLLPKFLPKVVSDFATLVIQSTIKKALEKTLIVLDQSSSQAQSSLKAAYSLSEYELKTILFEKMNKSRSYLTHDKHQALFDALFNSLCLDDVITRGQADLEKIIKKRDHDGYLGHLTIASEYFFNNNLEYLKSSDLENKYTTSITKMKAKILSVVSVKVNKLHGYGHLEEITGRRADRQLYTFKEGDFVDLYLNDIEDMLLLAAQHKLGSDIIDLVVALRISAKELYTPSFDPPRVVYEDLNKRKRVMRADELYKFPNETLKLVRDELHQRILNFRLGYNKEMSRRKWSATDKRRSELMVELIDKQMRERRIIRTLERLVGARELEMDYRLM